MSKYNRISKSQYLKGIQCPKKLWYYRHRKDLMPDISDGLQALFDSGHEVGELAQQYFRGGIEIVTEYYEIDKAIQLTKEAVKQGKNVIFEATACTNDGAYSKIDILKKVRGSDAWDLIDVKQSNSIQEYHYDDMALQRYAFAGAGYKIRKSILMHLNNEYVRSGELNVKQLFTLEDCTDTVKEILRKVKGNVGDLIKIINSKKEPVVDIGGHCKSPHACEYKYYCWSHIPEYSVHNVFSRSKKKLHDLIANNIIDISDIPDDFNLTQIQQIAVDSYNNNQIYIDKDKINDFLDPLIYPLYFFDYETIRPAVPLFDNSRPYQQIPFQFSLHIQMKKGGKLKHIEFLHTKDGDPRPDLLKALINNCGNKGSIIVFSKGFESARNNELGNDFPKYKAKLIKINDRMVDIKVPFSSRFLYHPKMEGSASLKDVLPAFVPRMSYDNLDIGDGGTASLAYLNCIKGVVSEEEKNKIYKNLIKYCKQDTLAEVKLLEILYKNG